MGRETCEEEKIVEHENLHHCSEQRQLADLPAMVYDILKELCVNLGERLAFRPNLVS